MFLLNTEQPQCDKRLLRYVQDCLVYEFIEKQFVEANRSPKNRKQIIYHVLRSENILSKIKRLLKETFFKQFKETRLISIESQPKKIVVVVVIGVVHIVIVVVIPFVNTRNIHL